MVDRHALGPAGRSIPVNHDAEAEAAFLVEPLIPVDPAARLGTGFRTRVVPHHLGVPEQCGQLVEVVDRHLTQQQPRRRQDRYP
jgi:hypothetical protein